MGLSGMKLDIVVVPRQQECPVLQTGGCKRGDSSRWSQDSHEGSLVCEQREATAIDVLVELANTVDQRQGLRSICHQVLCPIWQDMGEDSSNSITGCVFCQTDGLELS